MAESIATPSQMEQLLATGTNYDNWLAWLKSVRPRYVGTAMLPKIDAAIAAGESKRSTIGSVLTTVRDAWKWLKEQGGGALDYLKEATGLGFLPAIPAVWAYGLGASAVAAALLTMNNWINSTATLKREMDTFDRTYQDAVKRGADPVAAAQAASAAITGIVTADTGLTKAGEESGMGNQLVKTGGKMLIIALLAWGAYTVAQRQGWIK